MADPKKVVDDFTAKAAFSAGRDAARRAVEDLLSTDEEKAQREAERAAESKRRRKKLIAWAVVGAVLAIGILGMVIQYWQWFILFGLLGLGGLYGWYRLRKRFRPKERGVEEDEQRPALEAKKVRLPEQEPPRAEPVRQAAQREEARVAERREVDDELAELKARLKK